MEKVFSIVGTSLAVVLGVVYLACVYLWPIALIAVAIKILF
jgi:hypothetical protein